MAIEETLSVIKPDAVKKHIIGDIIKRFEKNYLYVVAANMTILSEDSGRKFYAVHKDKPFYDDLVKYITSGPILALVLKGENAVKKNREIMGNTDPQKAEKGTLRGDFGDSLDANVVHGSDSLENAKKEIDFFFKN